MRYLTTFITICLTLLTLQNSAQAGKLPETAKLLPAETVFFATIDSVDDLCGKFQKTNYYQLYKDPAMQKFFDQAKEKFQELVKEEEVGEFGSLILDSKLFPTGKIAFAGVKDKDTSFTDSDFNFMLIGQWNTDFDKVRKAIEKDIQKQLDDGAHRKKETFKGFDIITIITEQESPDPDETEPVTDMDYICFLDDAVVYCNNLDLLKFSVSQVNKSAGQTLWDDADYQAARKIVGPQYDIELYVNLKMIIEGLMAIESEDATMNPEKIIKTLGLDQLTGLSMAVEVSGNSRQSVTGKMMLRNPGQQKGIMKMLQLTSGAFKPPAFVSAQSCRVSYSNIDFAKAGDELGRILAGFSPMAAVIMTSPITAPESDGTPGVVLKTDILDNLGAQLIFSEELVDSNQDEKPFKNEQLYAIQIKDKQRIERSLSKIHSQFIATMKPETQREFLGHTIFSIPLQSLMPGMTGPAGQMSEAQVGMAFPVFAFTVTDSYLILGEESAIEQALRRLSDPEGKLLGQKKWHQYALSTIPADAQIAGFENMILYGKELWAQLKKGMDSGTLQFTLENEELDELMPLLKLLPEFEDIKKYFGLSVGWGKSRDDGFYYEFSHMNWKEQDN